MGLIRTEIELAKAADIANADEGIIDASQIRKVTVTALVDTGASMLVINEQVAQQLGLTIKDKTEIILADGSLKTAGIVYGVQVRFKTRRTTVDAIVVPGKAEVLLGAIPLEGMDVLIDMEKDEMRLPPDRPYLKEMVLKGLS